MALLGRPLFQDRIEAWAAGPVAVDLFRQLQSHEGPVFTSQMLGAPGPMTIIEKDLIETVWKRFRDCSTSGMNGQTDADPLWLAARNSIIAEVDGGPEITKESLAAYFTAELDKEAVSGITPRQDWASYQDFLEGRVYTKEEVFARLRGKACASS
jgi:hypothetical protein